MKTIFLLSLILIVAVDCRERQKEINYNKLKKQALEICNNNIIIDSHIDWPYRIYHNPEDISRETAKGDFDLPRAKRGGLNAVMSVIYINSALPDDEGRKMVDSLYKLVTDYPIKYPGKFALAADPGDVRNNFKKGILSIPICLENGSPIGNDPGYIKTLKERGVVYITLTHDHTNNISDSNFDSNHKWDGLSPFGKEVIKEMNRSGIIIDISHSTDSAVYQALRISQSPVVATHSNCRYFVPGLKRNLPDTLIKAIASKNGVVMVNMGSFFLDPECYSNWEYLYYSSGMDMNSDEGIKFARQYGETHKLYSDSKMVVDHIDHIVDIAGIDYVGIGSDYDGIGIAQPSDLPDVTGYPVIVFEMLKRGYNEHDIVKILSGNFLRVWDDVLKIADSLNSNPL